MALHNAIHNISMWYTCSDLFEMNVLCMAISYQWPPCVRHVLSMHLLVGLMIARIEHILLIQFYVSHCEIVAFSTFLWLAFSLYYILIYLKWVHIYDTHLLCLSAVYTHWTYSLYDTRFLCLILWNTIWYIFSVPYCDILPLRIFLRYKFSARVIAIYRHWAH